MKKLWGYLLAIFVLGGCIGDEFDTDKLSDEISIAPGVHLLLGYAELSMGDILSEETDQVKYYKDAKGNERIKFYHKNDSITHLGLSDFYSVGEASQSIDMRFEVFNAMEFFVGSESLQLDIPKIAVSQAEISYTLNITAADFTVPVQLRLEFPSINEIDGGRVIEATLSGNQMLTYTYTRDLVNLQSSETTNNQLPFTIWMSPVNSMNPYPNDIGSLTLSIGAVELHYIKGKAEENALTFEESAYDFNLDVLDELPDGIIFADPRIHLISHNSTPFKGEIIPLFRGLLDNGTRMNLATPLIQMSANKENEKSAIDTTTLDKSNSNIQAFMDELPSQLYYSGELKLNPGGEMTDEVELDETDRIYVGYTVELPLEMVIDSTVIDVDTLDLGDVDDLSKLTKGKIIVNSDNGLPLDVNAGVYLYDSGSETITDSIKTEDGNLLLKAAPVNSEGIATGVTRNKVIIELSETQIAHLQEADKLFLKLSIASTNHRENNPIVLLTTDKIALQLTLKGQLEY